MKNVSLTESSSNFSKELVKQETEDIEDLDYDPEPDVEKELEEEKAMWTRCSPADLYYRRSTTVIIHSR